MGNAMKCSIRSGSGSGFGIYLRGHGTCTGIANITVCHLLDISLPRLRFGSGSADAAGCNTSVSLIGS